MTTETPIAQFYGYLGRTEVAEGTATLHFYPYGFSPEEDGPEPVLEVVIDQPDFTAADLQGFIDGDVEIAVYPGWAQIEETCEGLLSRTLTGTRLSATRVSYDLVDYARQIKLLDEHRIEKYKLLHEAERKLNRLKSLTIELLRRAEIKAAASQDQRLRQAGAIEILHRMMVELDG